MTLADVYESAYSMLCGRHPFLRPWHFQWLGAKDLYRELRRRLPELEGAILDVGCGDKPYEKWATRAGRYVGIDVSANTKADFVVRPGERWPFEAGAFDAVLATQVLEHVSDVDNVVNEIERVLRPGGITVVTLPFVYGEHGAPADYRRFTAYGAASLFPSDWQLESLTRLGGVGSAVGVLVLNWLDETMNLSRPGRILKGGLLPLWIFLSALVNVVGVGADRVDRTSMAYVNLAVVFRKPSV